MTAENDYDEYVWDGYNQRYMINILPRCLPWKNGINAWKTWCILSHILMSLFLKMVWEACGMLCPISVYEGNFVLFLGV